jgi:hypothetical protein
LLATLRKTRRNIPRIIPDPIPGQHVRLSAGLSLADDVTVLRPGCPLGDGDLPDIYVLVDAYEFYMRGALSPPRSFQSTNKVIIIKRNLVWFGRLVGWLVSH